MSLENVQAFIDKVAHTERLHAPMIDAWTYGGMNEVIALGKAHGYEFTPEEVMAVRDKPRPDASPALLAFGEKLSAAWDSRAGAELTDSQLELVAGGTTGGGPVDANK